MSVNEKKVDKYEQSSFENEHASCVFESVINVTYWTNDGGNGRLTKRSRRSQRFLTIKPKKRPTVETETELGSRGELTTVTRKRLDA